MPLVAKALKVDQQSVDHTYLQWNHPREFLLGEVPEELPSSID